MFNFEKINLSLTYSPVFFFLALILLAGYSIYVYRYTIPPIKPAKKILLVSLRTLALLLLLFIFFEPVLTLSKKIILQPLNAVFIDNSRSILIKDGTKRNLVEKDFIKGLVNNNLAGSTRLYSFGTKTEKLNFDSLQKLNFSEGSTNFSKVFSNIEKKEDNIGAIVIVSDGVITEGANPIYTAEKINIPVFTVGVGDTTHRNDVEVKNVLSNQYIYAGSSTPIVAVISNKGLSGKSVSAALYENDVLKEQQNIILSEDGIQNVNFIYTPKSSGGKKIAIAVSNLKGEFTYANNKKVFYINVLNNKIKVLILAGAPSPDLSFIKNTLGLDSNLTINSITQIAANRFVEKNVNKKIIDSANVLILVGFPSKDSNDDLVRAVQRSISDKSKPYLIVLSPNVDFNKLKILQNNLGFIIGNFVPGSFLVQPEISHALNTNVLLQNNALDPLTAWNNLPPINKPNTRITAKPESEIISTIKSNNIAINVPLILATKLGNKKSISVLGGDIWRWKLETTSNNINLFDSFILNSIKWLNTAEDLKKVTIKTSKKLYSLGEPVEFVAEVYDESFNPVSDAQVKLNVSKGSDNWELNLSSIGNGLYEGTLQTNKPGDYSFSGEAYKNYKKLGKDNGAFNIGEVDVEMVNPRMDYEFLSLLSLQTGGKFFNAYNYNQLYTILKQINKTASKVKLDVSEINLWSDEWFMIIVILLLSAEWFIRKISGML